MSGKFWWVMNRCQESGTGDKAHLSFAPGFMKCSAPLREYRDKSLKGRACLTRRHAG